jgi:photosystem II stability/assembly factor-like uncharacterized protein
MKNVLPLVGILFLALHAFGQSDVTQITLLKVGFRTESLSHNFKNYEVYELPTVSNLNGNSLNFKMQFGEGKPVSLEINRNIVFDNDTRVIVTTPTGEEQVQVLAPLTYSGKEEGTNNACALTLNADMFCGFIQNGDDAIYWEPLFRLVPDAPKNLILYYHTKDVVPNSNAKCMVSDAQKIHQEAQNKVESNPENMPTGCYEIEFAQAADYSMWQKYGGASGVTNYLASVMNLAQANYDDEFNWNLQLKIKGVWLSSCIACDPWTTSTDPTALLESFRDWAVMPNSPFLSIPHDLGELWTNRIMNGFIGWAWVGVACWDNFKYHWVQDHSSDIQSVRSTVSHETGHNLNAAHDGTGGFIMSPSAGGSNTWSQQSKNTINAYVQTVIDNGCFTSSSTAGFTFNINNLDVTFANTSTNATSYLWNFGDGQTSTQVSPSHTFNSPGSYNVCLTATGTCGTASTCIIVVINYDYCWHCQKLPLLVNSINDVQFYGLSGWAVGDGGTILTGSETSWQSQNSGTTNDLKSVHFFSGGIGWAVGDGGTILITNNAGISWQSQNSGTINALNAVQRFGSSGWAVGDGGTILKTNDGGTSWQSQNSGTTNSLNAIFSYNSVIGWLVGDGGTILKTNDGGTTWQSQNSGTINALNAVHLYNNINGCAVGDEGTILITNDGGMTWQSQNSGTINALNSLNFSNNLNGCAVGDGGTILITNDGGMTWQSQNSGTANDLINLYFPLNSQTGWAVGNGGTFLKTNNSGTSWQNVGFVNSNKLTDVHFANDQTGWAVGNGGTIVKTSNGGTNWQYQPSGTMNYLTGVHFVNGQTGWAVGNGGTILKTNNGGTSWQNQSSGTTNHLNDVYFVDNQTGWAVGNGGTILKTNNGGTSWQNQSSGTTNHLNDVYFVDNQTGWTVGDGGTILKTNDSGVNWQSQISGTGDDLEGVHFVDGQTGWVVGRYAMIKTINGGMSWQDQSFFSTYPLTDVQFINSQTGWTVSDDNAKIFKTNDGGTSWQVQTTGTYVIGIHIVDNQTGWAVGYFGTILKLGTISSPLVQNLSLCKNAPAQPLTATGTNLLWYTTPTGGTGSTNAPTPNTNVAGTTTYYVSQSPIGFGNCTESERVAITVTVISPMVNVSSTNSCNNNGTAAASPSGSVAPYSYLWSNSQTTQTISNLPQGDYSVTVTDASGCTASASTPVAGGQAPVANFGYSANALTVSFSNTSTNATSYSWNFGNGQTSIATNPSYTYPSSGTYNVCLTATGVCGSVQSCQTVTVSSPNDVCWHWQNPLPQGDNIEDVYFANQSTGWLVGAGGMILKTENGGVSWQKKTTGTTTWLYGVYFPDAQIGWAVGEYGKIIKTTNGGNSWITQNSIGGTFYDVYFVDTQTGWVVGENGTILKTTNGGSNWQSQTSGTTVYLNAVTFHSAQIGWVIGGNGTILKTTNGGTTWTPQNSTTTEFLLGIDFINEQTGWVVGNSGKILQTTNGGASWQSQTSGTILQLRDVQFINNQLGWAVGGGGGTVLHTNNGGTSWTIQSSNTDKLLHALHFTDAQTGWAFGWGGTIINTKNGGVTWESKTTGNQTSLGDVDFVDNLTGWAVGLDGTILRTMNGGGLWVAQASGTDEDLWGLKFVDNQNGWIVGTSGIILKTSTGGTTWAIQSSGVGSDLLDVQFLDSQNGWAAGKNGVVLKTTNGGTNWSQLSTGITDPLTSIYFVNNQTGWAVGGGGKIIATTNGGNTWQIQVSGVTGCCMNSVKFIDTQTGWIASRDGIILKTTNGGSTWQSQFTSTVEYIDDVQFLDSQNGWAVGSNGSIFYTNNGGTNWLIQRRGGTEFYAVDVTDFSNGWAVGPNGVIVKFGIPVKPATQNISYCKNAVAQPLTANGSNLLWFTTPTGGTGTSIAPIPLTNNIGTTTYYVSQSPIGTNVCTESERAALTVSVTAPSLGLNYTSGCPGGTATVNVSSGNSPFTYMWSNGQTTSTITNVPSGFIAVTVTDATGCANSSVGSMPPGTSPMANITNTVSPCEGQNSGSATVTATGGVPNYIYLWSNGQTGATANNLTAGTYIVTVTGSNGCTTTVTATLTSAPAPTASISNIVSPCAGQANGSATVVASGGTSPYTYLWSNGQTGITATNLATGTYTVTVAGSNSCSSTMTAIIGTSEAPILGISNIVSPCLGQSDGTATVTTSGGVSPYTYLWSNGQTIATVTNLASGNYTVTVTGNNGCTSTATAIIAVSDAPTSGISNTVSPCTGQSNGSATVSASGGVLPYTYLWSNGQTEATANDLTAGNYAVTVTGNNGCTSTATATVSTAAAPTASINNTVSPCTGFSNGSATVSASGGVLPYTYLWSNGQTEATANDLTAGNYAVTVTGNNGCTSTATATVSTAAAPTASINNTVSPCTGFSNGSATVSASGGVLPYTYLWSNGQTEATANDLTAGNYAVTVTGNNGCTSTATATVSTAAAPTASINNTVSPCTGFSNGSATVSASGGVLPYTYLWSNGQTEATANDLTAGNYAVTVTGNNGCSIVSTAILINTPVFGIELLTNLEIGGLNCQSAANPLAGTPPFTYAWSNGQITQTANNLSSGQFTVTVTDATGCTSVQMGSCVPVSTDDIKGLELFSVRPNPASTNLVILIRLTHVEQVQIKLFNSLGQRLFESHYDSIEIEENIDLNGVPSGCYFLQVSTPSGNKSEVISVVR